MAEAKMTTATMKKTEDETTKTARATKLQGICLEETWGCISVAWCLEAREHLAQFPLFAHHHLLWTNPSSGCLVIGSR